MLSKTSGATITPAASLAGNAFERRLNACGYDSIRVLAQQLDFSGERIPGTDELNRLAQLTPATTQSGHAIRFTPQNMDPGAEGYEMQIFATGQVPTRPNTMHDVFNALVWLTFPATKAAINARHIAARDARNENGNRGPVQDALTLLDECGVIVVSDQPPLLDLITEFQWKELFWTRRDAVKQHMKFLLFGHGLMEQLLDPFVGLVGKALLINVESAWLGPNIHGLLQHIDARSRTLTAFPASLSRGRDLAPLPVLGIPGWSAENDDERYYDNVDYFRPGRGKRPLRNR
jgi:Protein of unknown function (DUF3025)